MFNDLLTLDAIMVACGNSFNFTINSKLFYFYYLEVRFQTNFSFVCVMPTQEPYIFNLQSPIKF